MQPQSDFFLLPTCNKYLTFLVSLNVQLQSFHPPQKIHFKPVLNMILNLTRILSVTFHLTFTSLM